MTLQLPPHTLAHLIEHGTATLIEPMVPQPEDSRHGNGWKILKVDGKWWDEAGLERKHAPRRPGDKIEIPPNGSCGICHGVGKMFRHPPSEPLSLLPVRDREHIREPRPPIETACDCQSATVRTVEAKRVRDWTRQDSEAAGWESPQRAVEEMKKLGIEDFDASWVWLTVLELEK